MCYLRHPGASQRAASKPDGQQARACTASLARQHANTAPYLDAQRVAAALQSRKHRVVGTLQPRRSGKCIGLSDFCRFLLGSPAPCLGCRSGKRTAAGPTSCAALGSCRKVGAAVASLSSCACTAGELSPTSTTATAGGCSVLSASAPNRALSAASADLVCVARGEERWV